MSFRLLIEQNLILRLHPGSYRVVTGNFHSAFLTAVKKKSNDQPTAQKRKETDETTFK